MISLFSAKTLAVAQALPWLAAPKPGDPGGQGEDFGKSSPVGLLVLILFFIAVGFLVRSMTKHLRKIPASFDEPTKEDSSAAKSEDAAADAPDSEGTQPAESPEPPRAKPAEANSHRGTTRPDKS